MSNVPRGANKVKPVLRDLARAKLHSNSADRLFSEFDCKKQPISYPELAKIIERQPQHTLFVLDSSFIGRHEIEQCLWDALFEKRVVIPYFVWHELQEVLQTPFANEDAAQRIRQAQDRKSDRIILDHETPVPAEYLKAREYYMTLLSSRKQRSISLVEEFRKKHGRLPDKVEMDTLFQHAGADRDFHLLHKGYSEYRKQNFFADEDVVVLAAMVATVGGCATVVLTRDGDVFDQFCKLTTLLTIHYLAMQFAQLFAESPDSFTTKPMPRGIPEIDAYFNSESSMLVRKPVQDLDTFVEAILPKEYSVVPITCVLLGGHPGDMTRSFIRYFAEKDMIKLFETKGKTLGLSTDCLGGRNCHVTGFPKGIDNPREWVVVCEDKCVSIPQGDVRIAQLDYAHTNFHSEARKK